MPERKIYYYNSVYSDNIRMFKYKESGFIVAISKDEARKIWKEKYPEGYTLTELFSIKGFMNNSVIATL